MLFTRCLNCQTTIVLEARFCRLCGHPQYSNDNISIHEATTRHLEMPMCEASPLDKDATRQGVSTPNGNASSTSTTLTHHATTHVKRAPITQRLRTPHRNRVSVCLNVALSCALVLVLVSPFAREYLTHRLVTIKNLAIPLPSVPPIARMPEEIALTAAHTETVMCPTAHTAREIIIRRKSNSVRKLTAYLPQVSSITRLPRKNILTAETTKSPAYPNAPVPLNANRGGAVTISQISGNNALDKVVQGYERRLNIKDKLVGSCPKAVPKSVDTTSIITIIDSGKHSKIVVTGRV